MSKLGIEDDIRDFWRTRPHRRSDQRKIAGVASAIALRYDLDPVLVRVAFIVLTVLGGIGAQLYLLGWLLLPSDEGETSGGEALLGRGRSSMSAAMTVVVAILLLVVGLIGFDNRSFWLFGAVLSAAALWLLHHYRADAGVPAGTTVEAAVPAMAGPPPPWSQGGGLGEPAEPPPAPRKPPVTAVTLGLALIAVGLCVALSEHLDAAAGLGIVLAVVCAGLIVGAFLRTGRGLIAVAVPLGFATLLGQVAPVDDADQFLGEARWSADSPAELDRDYTLVIGSLHLDLRDLQVPAGTTARTKVASDVGEITIFLPRNLDVELSCRVQVGEAKCLDRRGSGIPGQVDAVQDDGPDGPGGGRLVLDVEGGIGSVEVTR